MRKTSMRAVVCVMLMVLLLLPGCSKKKQTGIEGTWELYEEYDKDGTKVTADDLKEIGVFEKYEIKGKDVTYTCELKEAVKPIVITLTMEELGNNKYCFKVNNIVFPAEEITLDGDYLLYEVGSVEMDNYMKMVFKRK